MLMLKVRFGSKFNSVNFSHQNRSMIEFQIGQINRQSLVKMHFYVDRKFEFPARTSMDFFLDARYGLQADSKAPPLTSMVRQV